jgi:hypothetical protein
LDEQYESTATDISRLKARAAYLDGELCAVNPDGTTSFAELQAAPDSKSTTHLVYFVFDLLLPGRAGLRDDIDAIRAVADDAKAPKPLIAEHAANLVLNLLLHPFAWPTPISW